jgi:CubicO group peptidase (beta-lactamase class C family)
MRIIAIAALYSGFLFGFAAAAEDSQQRVDRIFSVYNRSDSAGCALGVIQNGAFVYRRGYGAASIELSVPLSPASIFYMGSVSKQFTATSVVLAAEQGFLSLDDDVRKYIPELPDYGRTITLRQMLHHTSGFKDFLTLLSYSGRDPADIHSDNEVIDLIARQKSLNNIPGDEFIYSNTNYFLLGEVVKRATRKPLAEFASEKHFSAFGYGAYSLLRRSQCRSNGAGFCLQYGCGRQVSCRLVNELRYCGRRRTDEQRRRSSFVGQKLLYEQAGKGNTA